jgi:phage terminase large subunit GpA-like protein
MSISEASEKYIYLNTPGAYIGPYRNSSAHYMVEPMNMLASRVKSAVIFVGPSQSGKTQALLLNWLAYSVKVDPMDMILYSPTQTAARDFSMRRVDRLHRHSKPIGEMLMKKRDADNKFDKHYVTGMMLSLSHPSVAELAGRPAGRIGLTDYDRMPDDVGGDGSPFDLASKRTTTFGSFAMTLAESSPSRPIIDPKWIAKSPHEAPPSTGILALYNRGDRRRRYWPCVHCDRYFEPRFHMFLWEELANSQAAAETVRLVCPHCSKPIHPDDRADMDEWGIWLPEGQHIDDRGIVRGPEPQNNIASYWAMGPVAAFTTWKTLVKTYLDAEAEFQRSGSQEALKKFWNNDMGEPYLPKGVDTERLPEVIMSRAESLPVVILDEKEAGIGRAQIPGKDAVRPLVPENVRFLVAMVDIQKIKFVVQVFGISPGEPFDITVIDRFDIIKSERMDEDGEHRFVKPHTYLEDWDLLKERVMERTYDLSDGSGRRMMIKLTGSDSGGKEGVTTNAYNFQRKMRKEGFGGRFHLIKGDPNPSAPRTRIGYPDSSRRDKLAVARGDVPVLFLNPNQMKDVLANRLDCIVPGKGLYRTPNWLPDWFYKELCAEVRTSKGWENPGSFRNETWDLSYYAIGVCVSPLIRVEMFDWSKPPSWAETWDKNALVFQAEGKTLAEQDNSEYDLAKLAASLA